MTPARYFGPDSASAVTGIAHPRGDRQEREGARFVVLPYSVGKGELPFKAGILENTSAIKSMKTIARVGSSLLAT